MGEAFSIADSPLCHNLGWNETDSLRIIFLKSNGEQAHLMQFYL